MGFYTEISVSAPFLPPLCVRVQYQYSGLGLARDCALYKECCSSLLIWIVTKLLLLPITKRTRKSTMTLNTCYTARNSWSFRRFINPLLCYCHIYSVVVRACSFSVDLLGHVTVFEGEGSCTLIRTSSSEEIFLLCLDQAKHNKSLEVLLDSLSSCASFKITCENP